jgi:DNA (cytosine-5)-methyltransferase 1
MSAIRFGSMCSGIEAASVAWGPLGWRAAWLAEIEPFPSAVLAHHYPDAPNLGDMSALPERVLRGEVEAPDVVCGGTPCQAFSVAGLRKSLDDARGSLSLTFCKVANAVDTVRAIFGAPPCVVVWENVPGVLNTPDNAFGCFLAALAGEGEPLEPPGGKWPNAGYVLGPQRAIAWRVLDAQYFGVAQRRRRVFVVASARNGFDPAAVLFEFDGVRRDTAPSREPAAGTLRGTDGGSDVDHARAGRLTTHRMVAFGEYGDDGTASAMKARDYKDATDLVAQTTHTLRGEGFDVGEDGTGRGTPLAPAMGAKNPTAVGLGADCFNGSLTGDVAATMGTRGSNQTASGPTLLTAMQVRRLTPVECERLQGFPDGYTAIPWRKKPADQCPDGPRYKALGNSWAVPNVRWIGARIAAQLDNLDKCP